MRIADAYTGPEMPSPAAWIAATVVLSLGLTLMAGAVIWQQRLAGTEARGQQERQVERLQAVASRLHAGLSASDMVARPGGDQFVVLLSPTREPAEAERVLTRLLDDLFEPIALSGGARKCAWAAASAWPTTPATAAAPTHGCATPTRPCSPTSAPGAHRR